MRNIILMIMMVQLSADFHQERELYFLSPLTDFRLIPPPYVLLCAKFKLSTLSTVRVALHQGISSCL